MSPMLRGLMTFGGCSITCAGIWQLHEYLNPKTILDKLQREGEVFYTFEDGSEDAGWKVIAQKYHGAKEGEKLNNVSVAASTPTDTEVKALRDECKRLVELTLDVDRTTEINQVKKWCTAGNPENITVPG